MSESAGTVAVLTPPGRGAVATVRWCGPVALIDETAPPLFQAASGQPLAQQPLNRIVYGRWGTFAAEDVVVCRTAEDELEIHCHGGVAAVRRITSDLVAVGGREVSWVEQQSLRTSGLEAELQSVLARASTLRTADLLLQQLTGGFLAAARRWQSMCWSEKDRQQVASEIAKILRWESFGLHLAEPWRVVLTGRPNVGKSSLINALLGYERAIVYDQPGTTLDVVTGETAFDGWPVLLADTAGLRETEEQLEAAGVTRARQAVQTADLILVLIDLSEPALPDDLALLAAHPDAIVVAHKCDLPRRWAGELPVSALQVSSITGAGVEELQQQLVARLVPELPSDGTVIPVTVRQVALLRQMQSALNQPTADDWARAFEKLWRGQAAA